MLKFEIMCTIPPENVENITRLLGQYKAPPNEAEKERYSNIPPTLLTHI